MNTGLLIFFGIGLAICILILIYESSKQSAEDRRRRDVADHKRKLMRQRLDQDRW